MANESLQDQIWNIAQRPENYNGFTVYTYGLNKPVSGYCVAYSDTQNLFNRAGLEKCISHAQTHSQVVGGWQENRKCYFDSVRIYHTEAAAVEAAIIEDQIAYYDISGQRTVVVREKENELWLLLPQYQNQLDTWNQQRQKRGMMPLRIYSNP